MSLKELNLTLADVESRLLSEESAIRAKKGRGRSTKLSRSYKEGENWRAPLTVILSIYDALLAHAEKRGKSYSDLWPTNKPHDLIRSHVKKYVSENGHGPVTPRKRALEDSVRKFFRHGILAELGRVHDGMMSMSEFKDGFKKYWMRYEN